MHTDFQLYCTEIVLASARDRILNELEEVRIRNQICLISNEIYFYFFLKHSYIMAE